MFETSLRSRTAGRRLCDGCHRLPQEALGLHSLAAVLAGAVAVRSGIRTGDRVHFARHTSVSMSAHLTQSLVHTPRRGEWWFRGRFGGVRSVRRLRRSRLAGSRPPAGGREPRPSRGRRIIRAAARWSRSLEPEPGGPPARRHPQLASRGSVRGHVDVEWSRGRAGRVDMRGVRRKERPTEWEARRRVGDAAC